MKGNAILRIVLYSIAILVLLCILGAGLAVGLYMSSGKVVETFHNAEQIGPISGEGYSSAIMVNPDEIRELEIEWVAGSISLVASTGVDQITISESVVTDQKYQMVCNQSGDKLTIQYCKESLKFPSFGVSINTDISKDLIITVPQDWVCKDLEIVAASANVEVNNLVADSVSFEGASGFCTFDDCIIEDIEIDTASGDVRFTGNLDSLSCNAMSAICVIEARNVPKRIDVNSMSGDLDITLPEYCGFSVSMDAMSSDFTSDFPTTTTNGNHVYGDGSCRINVDAMSGDVTIRKAS